MVVLNRIYTRTGDDGTTALSTGARRSKADLRVESYGTVDETNSVIGVARRAERLVVALGQLEDEINNPDLVKYLNRLSDFLFVAARFANEKGQSDVLWVPGANR